MVILWLDSYIKASLQSICVGVQLNWHSVATSSLFVEEFLNFSFKSTGFSKSANACLFITNSVLVIAILIPFNPKLVN